MKLKDARGAYQENSQKLGDNIRTIDLAGIAFIWVFSGQSTGAKIIPIPTDLLLPGIFLLSSLFFDVLQYAYATPAWGIYARHKEKAGVGETAEFTAPSGINRPTIGFLALKVLTAGVAYVLLGLALASRLH